MNDSQFQALAAKLTDEQRTGLRSMAAAFGSAGGFAADAESFGKIGDGQLLKIFFEHLPQLFAMILELINSQTT